MRREKINLLATLMVLSVSVVANAASFSFPSNATTVRCFGFEGSGEGVGQPIELRPHLLSPNGPIEYNGEGATYRFRTIVNSEFVILSVTTGQMPVGVGATSPPLKLEPLLKNPAALGRLSPTSVLTFNNPGESKASVAFVGCGTE